MLYLLVVSSVDFDYILVSAKTYSQFNHSNKQGQNLHTSPNWTEIQLNYKNEPLQREVGPRSDYWLLRFVHNPDGEHVATLKVMKLKTRS